MTDHERIQNKSDIFEPQNRQEYRLLVMCIKWGTAYAAQDVNVLFRAVRRHTSGRSDFLCLTDDSAGLDPQIIAKPIVIPALGREQWGVGCFAKLAMYNPTLTEGYDVVLFLDLDVAVIGSLDKLAESVLSTRRLHLMYRRPVFVAQFLPTFLRPKTRGNSSVVGFLPGTNSHLYENFEPHRDIEKHRNDQDYASALAVESRRFPASACVSFKHSVVGWPLSYLRPSPRKPKQASVVVFHGRPKLHDLLRMGNQWWQASGKSTVFRRMGMGPVEWVTEYWKTNGGTVP